MVLALGVGGRLAAGLEELRDHQHPGEDLGHVDLEHLGLEDVSMGDSVTPVARPR